MSNLESVPTFSIPENWRKNYISNLLIKQTTGLNPDKKSLHAVDYRWVAKKLPEVKTSEATATVTQKTEAKPLAHRVSVKEESLPKKNPSLLSMVFSIFGELAQLLKKTLPCL